MTPEEMLAESQARLVRERQELDAWNRAEDPMQVRMALETLRHAKSTDAEKEDARRVVQFANMLSEENEGEESWNKMYEDAKRRQDKDKMEREIRRSTGGEGKKMADKKKGGKVDPERTKKAREKIAADSEAFERGPAAARVDRSAKEGETKEGYLRALARTKGGATSRDDLVDAQNTLELSPYRGTGLGSDMRSLERIAPRWRATPARMNRTAPDPADMNTSLYPSTPEPNSSFEPIMTASPGSPYGAVPPPPYVEPQPPPAPMPAPPPAPAPVARRPVAPQATQMSDAQLQEALGILPAQRGAVDESLGLTPGQRNAGTTIDPRMALRLAR